MATPVIAFEVCVVKLVKTVRLPGERESIVSQPRSDPAVYDAGEEEGGVAADGHGDEGRGIVQEALEGVHRGAAQGGGVGTLVMQRVDVPVQPGADVGEARGTPRMEEAVDEVEMGEPPVREEKDPQNVGH